MNRFIDVVKAHGQRYPKILPQDAVKLAYQSEFGGGHLVGSPKESLKRLKDEYAAAVKNPGGLLWEDIGGGYARLHLAPLDEKALPLSLVNRMFALSAARNTGTMDGFLQKLGALTEAAENGVLPFSPAELAEYLEAYKKAGCPAAHHSDAFRKAYRPAYRVLRAGYRKLLPVIMAIGTRIQEKPRLRVAIDGPSASGKSTAAALLAALYDCDIIRMDDFFLPPPLRTKQRYEEAGGNIHYERFQEEVAAPLAGEEVFSYRVFDCAAMKYAGVRTADPKRLTLVEGAYSLHPYFGGFHDMAVFMTVGAEEQKKRLLRRNGAEGLSMFQNRWIPMENRYFDAFSIREKCGFVL